MNKNEFEDLFSILDKTRADIESIINRGIKLGIKCYSLNNKITVEIENHISLSRLQAIIDYFKPLGYYLHDIEAEDYCITLHFYDFEE